MALHDELVQRMKTVADTDSASDDDDAALSVVVFEPSNTDPDLGRVELQRVDPDRLPVTPVARPPNPEKKPTVATPAAVRGGSNGGGNVLRSSAHQQGPVPRRQPQLMMCVNKYGERQGELKDPLGVACLPSGEIVVSEWGNRRLQVFDTNGRSLRLVAPGQVNVTSTSLPFPLMFTTRLTRESRDRR